MQRGFTDVVPPNVFEDPKSIEMCGLLCSSCHTGQLMLFWGAICGNCSV